MERIELRLGDITKLETDIIVNAANTTLLGGGGVDGAIHRAAGKELLEECKKLNGCPTGEAKITKGYNLPAKYVIHTPGPVWSGGNRGEDRLLGNCYYNSLKIASEMKAGSVAFPAISAGAYRFPLERAANIAIKTTKDFLERNDFPQKVIFILFDEINFNIYKSILENYR